MPRKLFTDNLAERCKKDANETYSPCNDTEVKMFCSLWCSQCQKKGMKCDILTDSFWSFLEDKEYPNWFFLPDEKYPNEWIFGKDGQPRCTIFEEVNGA